jgi:hypothetical protein
MKLKCTIGSHGFVGGATYKEGDKYELEDEEQAKQIIKWGYAEEVKEVTSSVSVPPLIERDEVSIKGDSTVKEQPLQKTKHRKRY